MFFEIFFEHFSDLQSSEIRQEYETKVKRWYEREETERNSPTIALKESARRNLLLDDMKIVNSYHSPYHSPLGDIKIRKMKDYAFSMKASKTLYLTVRTDDEAIV